MPNTFQGLTTEQQNPRTIGIDGCSTLEMVRLMNAEDMLVPLAVQAQLENIAAAVDAIALRLGRGGRLFYIGAGTSGRLGVVDASECPPTFGTEPEMVQAMIAGGDEAIFRAIEGMEDNGPQGAADVLARGVCQKDALVGIASSGRTPYVIGAMDAARQAGAFVIGLCNTRMPEFAHHCDLLIDVIVGPEVITGSTRLKAGTSQKMVLNMLSTCAMIKLGKVYGNLMVDLRASNVKLHDRAVRIVENLTQTDREQAEAALEKADGSTKLAILMLRAGCARDQAQRLLSETGNNLRRAIQRAMDEKADQPILSGPIPEKYKGGIPT